MSSENGVCSYALHMENSGLIKIGGQHDMRVAFVNSASSQVFFLARLMMRERMQSLDVFRGMTVAFMILVNNPGSWSHIYPALRHAHWHGIMGADFVFPFFLFIMGVSTELSIGTNPVLPDERKRISSHIIRRTLILFALGLFLNMFPFFPAWRITHMRIPGVLQRIAVVYFITAFACMRMSAGKQHLAAFLLLAGYRALCAFVPVPGEGYPSIEPGVNLAAWLDRTLMPGHLWNVTVTWDPEGILSTVSAVTSSLLGASAGRLVRNDTGKNGKQQRLVLAGLILCVAGLAWHPFFPMNKSLWTGSYALFTAGVAMLFLALLRYLIDVRHVRWWTAPFAAMGVNSLAAFFLSSLLARIMNVITVAGAKGEVSLQVYLYGTCYAPHLSQVNASLAWALSNVFLWLAVAGLMYRKRIFVKL